MYSPCRLIFPGWWPKLLLCDSISLKTWQGQYVAAEANGEATANSDSVGKMGSKWNIFPRGDKIALKGAYGKYLAAESNGKANANWAKADNWELFEPVDFGDDKYGFKTHHNTYLVAGNDKTFNADLCLTVMTLEWKNSTYIEESF